MKKMILMGLLVALFMACSEQPKTKTIKGVDGKEYTVVNQKDSVRTDIRTYGNNIYFFELTGNQFSRKLSKFLDDHKTFEVVSIAPQDDYYGTQGYFVVFREKK